ncbi:MAG TPA: roadblock/LC7 domain-containing protein [Candidatus Deferrimicrobium sp.]|nr:roadblock/LC7 domain-containing protein [Candidatus Deferrimicrobium sp.]
MSRIVICALCGTQVEAQKRFCPQCGAPISPPTTNSPGNTPSQTSQAASTLFNTLTTKKQVVPDKNQPSPTPIPMQTPIVEVSKGKERPKTFKQKPLGVIKPETPPSTVKRAQLGNETREQLIEFLRGLNKLDRSLEASAVVKRDGTILASAHSTRAKPEMMATICSTLFGIAQDSIRAIAGGRMRMITVSAEQSVLMLTQINDDTILLLVTSPKSNIGLISMYSETLAQNIAKFLLKLA